MLYLLIFHMELTQGLLWCGCNFKYKIFKQISVTEIWRLLWNYSAQMNAKVVVLSKHKSR